MDSWFLAVGWRGRRGDAAAGDGAFRRVARALVIKAGFSRFETRLFFLWGDVGTRREGEAGNWGRCVSDHSVEGMTVYL